jgi:hypothetical protein
MTAHLRGPQATDSLSPELSVIVVVVDGGATLARCLEALGSQVGAPSLEIIVPFDDTISYVGALAERFPAVRFVPLGTLADADWPRGAFAQHDLYDRRRAGGLHAARGRLVAMVEDRGRPTSDWARAIAALHEGNDYAVVGGAVENGAHRVLLWAVYFCDFGRYQVPMEQIDPEYVTDVNICYKKEALHSVRDLWSQKYQEAQVNWALRRLGRRLYLSDRPIVVEERNPASLIVLLAERVQWGRVFGQVRGREMSRLRSLIWAAATPLIPPVLLVRHLRRQFQKRRNVAEFVRAMPAIVVLLHFWALGECIGYCESAFRRHR